MKRNVLVEELQAWHSQRQPQDEEVEDEEEINDGEGGVNNNFAILEVTVREKTCASKKRKSIIGLDSEECGIVSPLLLRPLRSAPNTPGKSCMKKTDNSDEGRTSPEGQQKRLSNIKFSPFNGVKMIAHRDTIKMMMRQEGIFVEERNRYLWGDVEVDGSDEDEDDDFEDADTGSNSDDDEYSECSEGPDYCIRGGLLEEAR